MAKKTPVAPSEPTKNDLIVALDGLVEQYKIDRRYGRDEDEFPSGLESYDKLIATRKAAAKARKEKLLSEDTVLQGLQSETEALRISAVDRSKMACSELQAMIRRVRSRTLTPKLIEEVQEIIDRWDVELGLTEEPEPPTE